MKKLLLKGVATIVFIVIIIGAFLIIKNSDRITGSVVKDVTPLLEDTADNIQQVVEDSDLKEIVKKKADELLKPIDSKELITKIIELRENSEADKTIGIANSVTEINNVLEDLKKSTINTAWQALVGCVFEDCKDDEYINMINAVAINDLNERNEVIYSVIETYNFWNGKNIIYFSESLSKTDSLIQQLRDEELAQKWKEVIDCDGKCESFTHKTVELIYLINNKE